MVARYREAWAKAEAKRQPGVTLDEAAGRDPGLHHREGDRPGGDERPRISCVFHNRLAQGDEAPDRPHRHVRHHAAQRRALVEQHHEEGPRRPAPLQHLRRRRPAARPHRQPGRGGARGGRSPRPTAATSTSSRGTTAATSSARTSRCHQAAVQEWQVEFFRARKAARESGRLRAAGAGRRAPEAPPARLTSSGPRRDPRVHPGLHRRRAEDEAPLRRAPAPTDAPRARSRPRPG